MAAVQYDLFSVDGSTGSGWARLAGIGVSAEAPKAQRTEKQRPLGRI